MEAQHISSGIILRMIAWGVASGAVLGTLFPLFVILTSGDGNATNTSMLGTFVILGCFAGFVMGGIAGLIIGFITGVVLATMTYRVFNPTTDIRRYRRVIEITCIVVGGSAALLLVLASGLYRGLGGEWSWLVWGVTPTLIATTATWWAGRHVAAWVVETTSNAG